MKTLSFVVWSTLSTAALADNPHLAGAAVGDDAGHDVILGGTSFFVVGEHAEASGATTGIAVLKHAGIDTLSSGFGRKGIALSTAYWADRGIAVAGVEDGVGGVVVVGRRSDGDVGSASMLRLDRFGEVAWERTFAGALVDVARDEAGRFVAVGSVPGSSSSDLLVVRVLGDGSDDTSFNGTGSRAFDFACNGFESDDFGGGVLLQPDGLVLVAGSVDRTRGGCGADIDTVVARLEDDGSDDAWYGSAGSTVIRRNGNDRVAALAWRDNGSVLVAGTLEPTATEETVALAALTYEGFLDQGFGNRGVASFGGAGEDWSAEDAIVLPDGRLLVAGRVATEGAAASDLLLARFSSNGRARDTTFDGDGSVRLHVGRHPDSLTIGNAVARLSDGSYVVVGSHRPRTAVASASDILVVGVDAGGTVQGDPSRPGPFAVGSSSYTAPAVTFVAPKTLDPGFVVTYDLAGEVRYPASLTGVDVPVSGASSTYPLVVFAQGSYSGLGPEGFRYLLDQLASHGYIAVVTDSRALANVGFVDPEEARARALLAHLDHWRHVNASSGPLRGRIDLASVAIIGHSQGGGAVVQAARINDDEGLGHALSVVISVSPTDFSGTAVSPATLNASTKYLCLYGSNDADVGVSSGHPFGTTFTGTGFRVYDRTPGEKAMVFAIDASHNLFNRELAFERLTSPDAITLTREEHETLLKGYVTAFLHWHFRGDSKQRGLFTGERVLPAAATVDVRTQYRPAPSVVQVIEDFDDAWPGFTRFYAASIATGFESNLEGNLATLEKAAPHSARGMKLRWRQPNAIWRTAIPSTAADFSMYGALSVRVGQTWGVMDSLSATYTSGVTSVSIPMELDFGLLTTGARDAITYRTGLVFSSSATVSLLQAGKRWRISDGGDEIYELRRVTVASSPNAFDIIEVWHDGARANAYGADQRFRVRLTDSSGGTAAVDVAAGGRVPAPAVPFLGDGPLDAQRDAERTLAALSTVRLSLAEFAAAGVDVHAITEVAFEMSASGELMFDDLELVP